MLILPLVVVRSGPVFLYDSTRLRCLRLTRNAACVGRTLAWREWPKFKITAIVKQ